MQIGGTKIGCIQIEVIEEPFCNNHDPQIIKFTQTVSKHFGIKKTAGSATIIAEPGNNINDDLCYDVFY